MSILTKIKTEGHNCFPYKHEDQKDQHSIKKYRMAMNLCGGFYTEHLDGIPEGRFVGANGGQILKFMGLYFSFHVRDNLSIGNGRISYGSQEQVIARFFSGPENIPIFTFSREFKDWWTESYYNDAVDNQNICLEVIRDWQVYLSDYAKQERHKERVCKL